jgi:hypothetical protein
MVAQELVQFFFAANGAVKGIAAGDVVGNLIIRDEAIILIARLAEANDMEDSGHHNH